MGDNFFGPFDPFRCQLEGPGENHCDWETQEEDEHDEPDGPAGNLEKGKDLSRDLDQEPGDDGISDRDLINIAPLQFGQEFARVQICSFTSVPLVTIWGISGSRLCSFGDIGAFSKPAL